MSINKKTYKGVYVDLIQEFICDTRADISNLPNQNTSPDRCVFGSTAFVIEDSSVWMLNSEGDWKEI